MKNLKARNTAFLSLVLAGWRVRTALSDRIHSGPDFVS